MRWLRPTVALLLCFCLLPRAGVALLDNGVPLPANIQLTLLGKVLSFDRALGARNNVLEIGILYQADYPASEAAKIELMRAAQTLSTSASGTELHFKPILIEGKPSFRHVFEGMEIKAVYVMPLRGLNVSELTRAAAANGVRTFSGVPEYVYEGVSVTVGTLQGRPAVFINLKTARAQGSDFSSQLLKLANVVE